MGTGSVVIIFKEYDNLKVGFGVPTSGHGVSPAGRLQALELRWGPALGPGPRADAMGWGRPCPDLTAALLGSLAPRPRQKGAALGYAGPGPPRVNPPEG